MYLHSSMDRLKECSLLLKVSLYENLHSSMDRLKGKLYIKYRIDILTFTFQYG